MNESIRLELANTVMRILDSRPRDNPKLTDHELLHIVKEYTGDNTMQLYAIHDAVSYLEEKGAVFDERFGGTPTSAFDYVKISRKGIAKLYDNGDWPKRAREALPEYREPKPEYHCNKCDVIINPTDEKCPNGHDLSIVGKKIKLTLTDRLTLSDSVDRAFSFAINKINSIVKDLIPETPDSQAKIDALKVISEDLKKIKTTQSIIVAQTRTPTLFQKFKENIIDYIITFGIGLVVGFIASA